MDRSSPKLTCGEDLGYLDILKILFRIVSALLLTRYFLVW